MRDRGTWTTLLPTSWRRLTSLRRRRFQRRAFLVAMNRTDASCACQSPGRIPKEVLALRPSVTFPSEPEAATPWRARLEFLAAICSSSPGLYPVHWSTRSEPPAMELGGATAQRRRSHSWVESRVSLMEVSHRTIVTILILPRPLFLGVASSSVAQF